MARRLVHDCRGEVPERRIPQGGSKWRRWDRAAWRVSLRQLNLSAAWPGAGQMTSKYAHEILSGKLAFGDPWQIAAKHYLEDLDAARRRLTECRFCGGVGRLSGRRGCDGELCWCLIDASGDILTELGV